jgi:hypothetical protein
VPLSETTPLPSEALPGEILIVSRQSAPVFVGFRGVPGYLLIRKNRIQSHQFRLGYHLRILDKTNFLSQKK